MLPAILAALPQEDYGKLQFAIAVQMWVYVFTGKNIVDGAKRGIAKGLDGTCIYALKKRTLLLCLTGMVALGLIGLYYHFSEDPKAAKLAAFGVILSPGLVLPEVVANFLVAKRAFKFWAGFRVIQAFLVPIAGLIAARSTNNIYWFAAAQWLVPAFLGAVFLIILSKKHQLVHAYKNQEIDTECYSYGLKMIPVDMVSSTSSRASHLIMGEMMSFQHLGVYSVASKLRERVSGIIRYVRQLLYADYATDELTSVLAAVWKMLVLTLLAGAIFAGAMAALGYFYIDYFLDERYAYAAQYFLILCAGLPAVLAGLVIQTAFESHLKARELTIAAMVTNIFRIIAIALACWSGEVKWVALAEVTTNWLLLFIFIGLLRKNLGKAKLSPEVQSSSSSTT